jgi:hypothetical protein
MPFAIRSITRAGRRAAGRAGLPAGALLLLGACSPDVGFQQSAWSPLTAASVPFSQPLAVVTSDSVTAQRVRGGQPEVTPLSVEPGNVWPAQEAQRATLMSGPDEAMRNIPDYSPSLVPSTGAPVRSPVATPGVLGSGPPAGLPGSRSPGGLGTQGLPPPPPLRPSAAVPPSPTGGVGMRPEGQVLMDPSGRPQVTTGAAGNIRGTTSPQGGGAVIRDGNVETFIGPDGRARTRVVPLGQ